MVAKPLNQTKNVDLDQYKITFKKMDLVWFLISYFSQNMGLTTFLGEMKEPTLVRY